MGRGLAFLIITILMGATVAFAEPPPNIPREQFVRETRNKITIKSGGTLNAQGSPIGSNPHPPVNVMDSVNRILNEANVKDNGIYKGSATTRDAFHVSFGASNYSAEQKIAKGASLLAEGVACERYDNGGSTCIPSYEQGQLFLSKGMQEKVDTLPLFKVYKDSKDVANATDGSGDGANGAGFIPLAGGTDDVEGIIIDRDSAAVTAKGKTVKPEATESEAAATTAGLSASNFQAFSGINESIKASLVSIFKTQQIRVILEKLATDKLVTTDGVTAGVPKVAPASISNGVTLSNHPQGITSQDLQGLAVDYHGTPIGVAAGDLFGNAKSAYKSHFGDLEK